ncbi:hypothetical protein ABIE26_002267 [Pedobacter africanus]|uniref:Uncharacterized protein n=1 Tax=Pedobacter africanus TaxID=151894 RepID=A0ACC6KYA6_9SPHI|nr:hypothetical protein [Pedobacter africanus]MDR6784344.1 hypothetical protein [Pedobacter africanus]
MNSELILLLSLLVVTLSVICLKRPKFLFPDAFNVDEMIAKYKDTPQENLFAYQDGIFSYQDSSFTTQLNNKNIHWDEITLIKAYKIDQYVVDCIVIEIHFQETFISINDQTAGHMKFMEMAAQKLDGFQKDWFTAVAFPAFETNLTIIYEKQNKN